MVDLLLSPVSLADRRQTRKQLLLVLERVREDHQQAADDRKIAEEEQETVAEPCTVSAPDL